MNLIINYGSQTYLDLGGALAALGLIFTAYQLRSSKWDIILRIRNFWQRNLFLIFAVLALVCTLTALLFSEILSLDQKLFYYNHFFYEIIAYLFFILSPISLIYLSTHSRGLFVSKNSDKFYSLIIQEISTNNDERINAVLIILLNNFENICKAAKNNTKKELRESACSILDVALSDESIVKILTTKRLDALQYIFETIEKYNITKNEAGIGISAIIKNLLYDKKSFFYKQLNGNGLALSSNIYETIYRSSIILNNFNLFRYPVLDYLLTKNISVKGIEVIIKSLSVSIETYLKSGKVNAGQINAGFSWLSDIFENLCFKISEEERRGLDTTYALKEEWQSVNLISSFLGHDYSFLAYKEVLNEDVVEKEKKTNEADFDSSETINSGFSAALYKAFKSLSYLKSMQAYYVVNNLLKSAIYEKDRKEGYIKPFEKRIWQQIAENLTRGHYPAVLKSYLLFFGFRLASDNNQVSGWAQEQAEQIRRLLYIDLKPLIDNKAKMADNKEVKDALLPVTMIYRGGKFFYKFDYGKSEEKIILPPPDESVSALTGINVDDYSLF